MYISLSPYPLSYLSPLLDINTRTETLHMRHQSSFIHIFSKHATSTIMVFWSFILNHMTRPALHFSSRISRAIQIRKHLLPRPGNITFRSLPTSSPIQHPFQMQIHAQRQNSLLGRLSLLTTLTIRQDVLILKARVPSAVYERRAERGNIQPPSSFPIPPAHKQTHTTHT